MLRVVLCFFVFVYKFTEFSCKPTIRIHFNSIESIGFSFFFICAPISNAVVISRRPSYGGEQ